MFSAACHSCVCFQVGSQIATKRFKELLLHFGIHYRSKENYLMGAIPHLIVGKSTLSSVYWRIQDLHSAL